MTPISSYGAIGDDPESNSPTARDANYASKDECDNEYDDDDSSTSTESETLLVRTARLADYLAPKDKGKFIW